MLSIVIPAYNEEKMIQKTHNVIMEILSKEQICYEILFVNDGSKDNTWEQIKKVCDTNGNVIGINFSKNFGKESAIIAGLSQAKGECSVVMDCDLQHPPQMLVSMYRMWENGYEVVEGVKRTRGKESQAHKFAAKCFYKIITKITNINMENASDFRLLDRKVVDSLLLMPEKHVFFRALSSWVGYKRATVEFEVNEREIGESKWSTISLIKYAVFNITSFTSAPMQIVTFIGTFFLIFSVILGIHTIYSYIMGDSLEGFTTIIIILLLIGSIIMISLGIIGHYLSLIYDEVKNRPRYIIKDVYDNKTCA